MCEVWQLHGSTTEHFDANEHHWIYEDVKTPLLLRATESAKARVGRRAGSKSLAPITHVAPDLKKLYKFIKLVIDDEKLLVHLSDLSAKVTKSIVFKKAFRKRELSQGTNFLPDQVYLLLTGTRATGELQLQVKVEGYIGSCMGKCSNMTCPQCVQKILFDGKITTGAAPIHDRTRER